MLRNGEKSMKRYKRQGNEKIKYWLGASDLGVGVVRGKEIIAPFLSISRCKFYILDLFKILCSLLLMYVAYGVLVAGLH